MRTWHGIQRNEGGTGMAAINAINVRFYTEGELWRRNAMTRKWSPTTAYTLTGIVCFMPVGGSPSLLQVDSNGTVTGLSAP